MYAASTVLYLDHSNLIYPILGNYLTSSDATFYYEYHYNLQDGMSLVALWWLQPPASYVEECFSHFSNSIATDKLQER